MTTQTASTETLPASLFELAESELDWESAPQVTVTCRECGNTHWHNKYLAAIFPNGVCDACSSAYDARTHSNLYLDPNQESEELAGACMPPIYLDTDPSRIPEYLREQVIDPILQHKGLWITGDTRTFKTRAACELIKAIIPKRQVTSFFHGDFHDALLDVMRKSEKSARYFKRKLTKTPVLFIDDLFSSKLTERSEATIFEIIDARCSAKAPTIITTQHTKSDLSVLFSNPKRLEALTARIKEFFNVVHTKPVTITPEEENNQQLELIR